MEKPKWQRARIVKVFDEEAEVKATVGRYLWVEAAEPKPLGTHSVSPQNIFVSAMDFPCYRSNLTVRGQPVSVDAEGVELLPEFADDAPLISWEDFLNATN